MSLGVIFLEIATIILVLIISLLAVARLWFNLRHFFHNNYSFFEALFIGLYFSEQALFTICYYMKNIINSDLLVGIFTITVLTTVSFEKLTMNSRDKKLASLKDNYLNQNRDLLKKHETVIVEYNKMKNSHEDILEYTEYLESKLDKLEKKLKKK